MKNLLRLTLAAGALIAFSGAQAGDIDFRTCTENPAPDLTPPDGWSSTEWEDGTYTGNGQGLATGDEDCWGTNINGASSANSASDVEGITGATDLMKVYDSTEGSWTQISGSDTDETSDADGKNETITITAQNGLDCSGTAVCYLLVKDGSVADPTSVIFDLSGWDGTALTFTHVFSGQGSISGYQFYAGENAVPEPMTLFLLGAGLVGFGVRRKLLA